MSQLTPMQAYRAINRALLPLHTAHANALQYDAGFDAGEFSGPAIDCHFDTLFAAAEARVLAQVGYTAHDMYIVEMDCAHIGMQFGVSW